MSTREISASEVCGVLDMDGFLLGGRFLAREAAFVSFDGRVRSWTFEIPRRAIRNLSPKDSRTARYVTRFVLGMPLRAFPGEDPKPLARLDEFVRKCYDSSRTPLRSVMGYKGGIHERDALFRLGIPAVNLEDFGCPKFDLLVHLEEFESFPSCRFHESPEKRGYHCPTSETFVFMRWTRRHALSECPIPPPVECPIPPPAERTLV